MFKLLQKLQTMLLGKSVPQRAADSRKNQTAKGGGKKPRRKTDSAQPRTARPEAAPRKAPDGAPRRERRSRSQRGRSDRRREAALPVIDASDEAAAQAALTPVKRPEMPAALQEVVPEEGKVRFLDLPLPQSVQFGVQAQGFSYCTPIQAEALPALLTGRDLGGKAQTGTGKTAAFLLAAFTRLLDRPLDEAARKPGQARVLVLAPTRELAIQIHKDAEALACYTELYNVVVFGGMDHEKQRAELRRPIDLLVGTPGRIIDYTRSGALDLSKVEILVIDEADRMLDMGFIPDVRRIVAQLPRRENRQTMLFSATLEPQILNLAQSFLHDPVMVESEPEKVVSENIEQTFYSVAGSEKLALLLNIIRAEPFDRMLIFGNRKDKNLDLEDALRRCGIGVELLSGDIAQQKRLRILEDFRNGKVKIVIATDVAARGIHVDDVSLVINYDLPERSEDYVHRIGRTGRAGHKGKSISFICEYGAYYIPEIEKFVGAQFHSELPTAEQVMIPEDLREKLRSGSRVSRSYGTVRSHSGRGGYGGSRGGRGGSRGGRGGFRH